MCGLFNIHIVIERGNGEETAGKYNKNINNNIKNINNINSKLPISNAMKILLWIYKQYISQIRRAELKPNLSRPTDCNSSNNNNSINNKIMKNLKIYCLQK